MAKHTLTDIAFRLEWKSATSAHTDCCLVRGINLEQDIFPKGLAKTLINLNIGESFSHTYAAKEIIGEDYSSDKVIHFSTELFDQHFKGQFSPPILYRFYPSAIAHEGLNTQKTDYTPFRIISINDDRIIADKNHPLAKYYLTLTATIVETFDQPADADKRIRNIGKLITFRGPGMQAPFEYGDSVFFDSYPFESNKPVAIQAPKKAEFKSKTTEKIAQLYSENLPTLSKVLDVLSDEQSYLDDNYQTGLLCGIGKNEATLLANNRLNTFEVQDLNENTHLPFEDDHFDDAICTLAIETLTDPIAVFIEVSRVVKAGGKFIVVFTSNASTNHPISLWGQLHPFEKIQLVLEYFRQSARFDALNTYSNKEISQPAPASNVNSKSQTDPIFAVWGNIK